MAQDRAADLADDALARHGQDPAAYRQVLRNAALSVVDGLPPARRRLAMNLSGLARRDLAELAA
jgi:hypothetical protein